jgi:hypothetical protein
MKKPSESPKIAMAQYKYAMSVLAFFILRLLFSGIDNCTRRNTLLSMSKGDTKDLTGVLQWKNFPHTF